MCCLWPAPCQTLPNLGHHPIPDLRRIVDEWSVHMDPGKTPVTEDCLRPRQGAMSRLDPFSQEIAVSSREKRSYFIDDTLRTLQLFARAVKFENNVD